MIALGCVEWELALSRFGLLLALRLRRRLFRFGGRQRIRRKVVHVDGTQTALFGFHQNFRFVGADLAFFQRAFRQTIQTGERQVLPTALHRRS